MRHTDPEDNTTPSSTVRPTATSSVQTSSSQLAATSMAIITTRDGSQGTTIASPSTEADGTATDVPSTSVTGAGQEKKAPPGGRTLPVAIGAAVGVNVLVLTAIIVTVVIVMRRRRNPTPVPPSTSPKAITDVTTDVTSDPEPTYDTIREEEEGGVQLALSGATCSYSAIGQPNVTSGPDRQVPVYSKPDKNKAKTPRKVEDLYAKPNKKESGEVENVLYESSGDLGASSSQGGTDNVLYASADEI
ncbi:hypothetical protein Bbelb_219350 [Branchiostoma belcheri]|nr:hypothetical protein Bbelb_219350 [Branchiostoma belcheri]